MLQVDRKFLEEQVKQSLREKSLLPQKPENHPYVLLQEKVSGWTIAKALGAGAVGGPLAYLLIRDDLKDYPWFKWIELVEDLLISVLVGAPASWKIVAEDWKTSSFYGSGISGIYSRVSNEFELDVVERTLIKFIKPVAVGAGELIGEMKGEMIQEFYASIDKHSDKLVNVKNNNRLNIKSILKSYYKEVDALIRKNALGNDPSTGDGYESFSIYMNRFWTGAWFGIEDQGGSKHYRPGHNDDGWLSQETKAIAKLAGNEKQIKDRLESGIFWLLSAAPSVNSFYELARYGQKNNRLMKSLVAAAAAKYHAEQNVFLAYADIILSLIGTVALIMTFGGASPAIAGTQTAKKGTQAVTSTVAVVEAGTVAASGISSTLSTAAKAGTGVSAAAKIGSIAFKMSEFAASIYIVLDEISQDLSFLMQRYSKFSNSYFEILNNSRYSKEDGNPLDDDFKVDDAPGFIAQSVSAAMGGEQPKPEEKENKEFVQVDRGQHRQIADKILKEKLLPLLEEINSAFYRVYGLASSEVPNTVAKLQREGFFKKKMIKALKSGNKEQHDALIGQIAEHQAVIEKSKEELKKRNQKLESSGAMAMQAAKKTDKIAGSTQLKIPANVSGRDPSRAKSDKEPVKPDEQLEEPTGKPDEEEKAQIVAPMKISADDVLFVGDSIADGMWKYGAGQRGESIAVGGTFSYQILKSLRKYFEEKDGGIKEQKSKKTIVLSAGTNDAYSGSVTNGGWLTPKKTNANIDAIVALAKKNGYDIKIMPLIPDGKKNRKTLLKQAFDPAKHAQYIAAVNSHIDSKGYTTFDSNIQIANDGIHPTAAGYKNLISNALGSISVSKVVGASGGTSAAAKDLPTFAGGVDKINRFFNRSPKQMKSLPRTQREAAVRKYYQISGATGRTGLPLEVLVQHIGAESNYINKDFLGDTNIKAGPSYGLGQILRTTGIWLLKQSGNPQLPSGTNMVDFLNVASNNLDMTVKQFEWNRRYLSKKSWFQKADESQKNLFLLYSYNMGPGGPGKYIKRAGGNIDLALNNLNDHYVKRWKMKDGYGHKIVRLAGQSTGTVDFDDVSVSGGNVVDSGQTGAAQDPEIQKEKLFSQAAASVENITTFEELAKFFWSNFNHTGDRISRFRPKMKTTRGMLEQTDLAKFKEDNVKYLKLLHDRNKGKWKREYDADISAAAGDQAKIDLANKKIAYYHRPIVYAYAFTSTMPNFDSTQVSFAFDPVLGRNSVDFGGDTTFYKEDYQGDINFQKFISKVKSLLDVNKKLLVKLGDLLESEPEQKKNIDIYVEFIQDFVAVLESSTLILSDKKETALRKGYAISILDRTFKLLS